MDARAAAQKGDVGALKRIAQSSPTSFSIPDNNGWTPFHEAVRLGNLPAVKVILESDAKLLDLLTFTGVTPLNIAREYLGKNHPVAQYLVEWGAIDKHPHHNMNNNEL